MYKKFMIGKKLLRISSKDLAPGSDDTGGVIIDSGFAVGYMGNMVRPVYNL